MAGRKSSFGQRALTKDEIHTIWLAEKSVLQKNLQYKNQTLSARRNRQLSTLQEHSETISQFEHVVYTDENDLPFLSIHSLGNGSIGQVDCIVHEAGDDGIPTAELARKVIYLRGPRRHLLPKLQEEVAVMKSLVHEHIVQITGTYETLNAPRQFGILMLPAGDEDLSHFLASVAEKGFQKRDIQKLEKWLLCLASALDYAHSQGIRHTNIKPQNIICKSSEIFLTDFGSAHKSAENSYTIIGSRIDEVSYMYSAPEVIFGGERGTSADIFSLGCIYLEMATVITNRRIGDFYSHRIARRTEDPSQTTHMYHATQNEIKYWFEDCSWPDIYDLLSLMISKEPAHRPRAFEVVATFVAATTRTICKCAHGPILLPKHWDLSIQFELLPGLIEHPSPGSTFGLPGLPISRPEEILGTARREAEAEIARRNPGSASIQTQDGDLSSSDLLRSWLALVEDPANQELQKRYSDAEAVSLWKGVSNSGEDKPEGERKYLVFNIPPLTPPQRPRRDFSASQPLEVELLEEDFI